MKPRYLSAFFPVLALALARQVPGIGPATAEKILTMRKSYGAFKSVDDLLAIKGLGKKRLEKMRKYLTVGKPSAAKQSPKATSPPADSDAPQLPL
jgi:competence ComEA-like helix-hairpin-helix protein